MRHEGIGLDYFRARHYAPAFGRFMQADPSNIGASAEFPQTWHGYNYVANNPLTYTDPSGMSAASFELDPFGGLTYYVDGMMVSANQFSALQGAGAFAPAYPSPYSTPINYSDPAYHSASNIPWIDGTITYLDPATGKPLNTEQFEPEVLLGAVPSLRSITPAIYTVYLGVTRWGQQYVGISNDWQRRAAEHMRSPNQTIIQPMVGFTNNLTFFAAKGIEQIMIQQRGLQNLANRINSISTTNPLYRRALADGCMALSAQGIKVPGICP